MKFWRDRRGGAAVVVAIMAIPMLGMMALSIDVGSALYDKTKLDFAADSAALLATSTAANLYAVNAPNIAAQAQAAAASRFAAASAGQPLVQIGNVNVSVVQSGAVFSATVSYTASMPTMIAGILGIHSLPMSGEASTRLAFSPFVNVAIMMDVSSSMTIAGTPAAIAQMNALSAAFKPPPGTPGNFQVGEACSFACHWSNTTEDLYQLALHNNVALRLTLLQQAVSNMIGTMIPLDNSNRFQIGLYTFDDFLHTVYPLSQNLSGANQAVPGIVPGLNSCLDDQTCANTYFTAAMQSLTGITAPSGDGGTQATAQQFVFIVTDGVYDQYIGGRDIGPMSPADCAALKAKGVSIMVLYTPYIPIPTNDYYRRKVLPIAPQIQPDLQACASSPAYFFQATDATSISAQLQQMFQLVLKSSAHLTM